MYYVILLCDTFLVLSDKTSYVWSVIGAGVYSFVVAVSENISKTIENQTEYVTVHLGRL